MTRAEALKHIRWVFATYSVTHAANCKGKDSRNYLDGCTCEAAKALRALKPAHGAAKESA